MKAPIVIYIIFCVWWTAFSITAYELPTAILSIAAYIIILGTIVYKIQKIN